MMPTWNMALWLLLATPLAAQTDRGLIDQALDETSQITLDGVTLREAFAIVTEQTGVVVVMTDAVMALAPYGPHTRVDNVRIDNIPLRLGIQDLVRPLGMTFIVLDDRIEIIPTEPIARLGRPATWEDLDTLNRLRKLLPGRESDSLATLRTLVQFHVPAPNAWATLADALKGVGAGPGDQVLSVACDQLGWAWYLDGPRIVIASIELAIRQQLQRPISLRIGNRPLFDVTQAVARAVGIRVRIEPGALEGLPMPIRQSFSLTVHMLSGEETLDKIAAYAGLGYLIDADGVLYYAASRPVGAAAGAGVAAGRQTGAHDPYVATVTVPMADGAYQMEWLIRQSELPDELRALRRQHLEALFEAVVAGEATSP